MSYIYIPKMGESVSEATISKWLKKEGDTIDRDEVFIEVATDKVESEIPSEYKCELLKILKSNGEKVSLDEPIAEVKWLEKVIETTEKTVVKNSTSIVVKADKSLSNENYSNEFSLSPLVKRIFKKNGVSENEIKTIKGTGFEGRITKGDAENYINNRSHHIDENQVLSTSGIVANKLVIEEGDEEIAFDNIRQKIAEHMTISRMKSAHCTSFSEIDVTDLVQYRESVKESFQQKHSTKLTYTHLMMYLIVDALRAYPKINAHQSKDSLVIKKNINLGFATLLKNDNLIVPVVKLAQNLSLYDIVKKVGELASSAKAGKIATDDISGGTFTISNTGVFGSMMGTPIINQPQVAIMSLGEIVRTPTVVNVEGNESIEIRSKMIASLSYDHRVIDGAYASLFLKKFKENIENFVAINY